MDKTKYKPLASYDKSSYDKWVHDELPRYMKIRIRGEVGQVAVQIHPHILNILVLSGVSEFIMSFLVMM